MKKTLLTAALAFELLPCSALAVTAQTQPPPRPHTRTATHHVVIHRRVVYRRTKKQSLAIVAGSAATGASIGAMAGGGIGAGIGAVAGGASGFIYDRITHKKTIYYAQ